MPPKGEMKVQLDEAHALLESLKQELGRITEEKDELAVKLEEVTDRPGLTSRGVTRDGRGPAERRGGCRRSQGSASGGSLAATGVRENL